MDVRIIDIDELEEGSGNVVLHILRENWPVSVNEEEQNLEMIASALGSGLGVDGIQ